MQFIGIAGQADTTEMVPFINSTGTGGFPQIADESGELWEAFGTGGRSTFLFINDDGSSELTTYGSVGESQLEEQVQNLLAS